MDAPGTLESRRPEIGFLNTRSKHHARASGYHPICRGLGPELQSGRMIPNWADWLFNMTFRLRRMSQAANVLMAMRQAELRKLFILNGEWRLKMASSLVRISSVRVGCTFHHCPDELENKVRKLPSAWIDMAICVSRCQIPLVQRLVKKDRCWFIPHGVDTEAFHPDDPVRRDANLVLSVGIHRRDLQTLRAAARLIRRRRPATRVVFVAPRALLPRGVDWSGLELQHDIPDAELLRLYQEASVLLLPLQHATANNSILEAMACGLPMVTTRVGGVVDYVTPECARLCPVGNVEEHVEQTMALLADARLRQAMSDAGRENALRFAWPRIREELRQALAAWD